MQSMNTENKSGTAFQPCRLCNWSQRSKRGPPSATTSKLSCHPRLTITYGQHRRIHCSRVMGRCQLSRCERPAFLLRSLRRFWPIFDLWTLFALRIEQKARFDFMENNSYQSTMGTLNGAISAPCMSMQPLLCIHMNTISVGSLSVTCTLLHISKPGVKSPQTTWPHLCQMVDYGRRGLEGSRTFNQILKTYGPSTFSAGDNSGSHSSSWHPGVFPSSIAYMLLYCTNWYFRKQKTIYHRQVLSNHKNLGRKGAVLPVHVILKLPSQDTW